MECPFQVGETLELSVNPSVNVATLMNCEHEHVLASGQDAFLGGCFRQAHLGEDLEADQRNTGFSAGLGNPWDIPKGDIRSSMGELCLGFPAETADPTTQKKTKQYL